MIREVNKQAATAHAEHQKRAQPHRARGRVRGTRPSGAHTSRRSCAHGVHRPECVSGNAGIAPDAQRQREESKDVVEHDAEKQECRLIGMLKETGFMVTEQIGVATGDEAPIYMEVRAMRM